MFLWDYLSGLLYSLGLYKKSGKLLFLGLDNSGNYHLPISDFIGRLDRHSPLY